MGGLVRADRFAAASALVNASEQAIEAAEMVQAIAPECGSYCVDWGEVIPREARAAFRRMVQRLRPEVACVWGSRGRHVALVGPREQVAELRRLREASALGMAPMSRGGDA